MAQEISTAHRALGNRVGERPPHSFGFKIIQAHQGSDEFVVTSFCVKWTIRDCFFFPKSTYICKARTLSSPQFRFLDEDWRLVVNGGDHIHSPGEMSLRLRKICRRQGLDSFHAEMSIRTPRGKVIGRMSGECKIFVNVTEIGTEKTVEGAVLECVNEDAERCHVLRVFCSLSEKSETTKVEPEIPEGLDVLSQNLRDLLLKERLCDVSIKIEDEELRAHRAVLAAQSPVLKAMLEHDTAEKRSGLIEISDSSPVAFKEFLQYLYSGRSEGLSLENVCDVYRLADKYDVAHLRTECVAIMTGGLNEASFCDIISLATMYGEPKLVETATDFFIQHVKSVLPTARWQSFMAENVSMANDLFLKTVNKRIADE